MAINIIKCLYKHRLIADIFLFSAVAVILWCLFVGLSNIYSVILILVAATSFCLAVSSTLHPLLRVLFFLLFIAANIPLVFLFLSEALKKVI